METPPNLDIKARERANIRLAIKLGVLTLGFLGFGFALVPLYDVFCQLTGINAPPKATRSTAPTPTLASHRMINVEFSSQVMSGLPIAFYPLQERMQIRIGEKMTAKYFVRNLTNQTLIAQAVYSLTPPYVSGNFHKIDCFCFSEQKLSPGEARELPVEFYVDADIPEKITDVALSYSFYLHPDKVSYSLR